MEGGWSIDRESTVGHPATMADIDRLAQAARHVVAMAEGRHELWPYELPSLRLRRRDEYPYHSPDEVLFPDGTIDWIDPREHGPESVTIHTKAPGPRTIPLSAGASVGGLRTVPDWLLLLELEPNARSVRLLDTRHLVERARIRFEGASHIVHRACDGRLALADDRGRILVLDLETGRLLSNLRI